MLHREEIKMILTERVVVGFFLPDYDGVEKWIRYCDKTEDSSWREKSKLLNLWSDYFIILEAFSLFLYLYHSFVGWFGLKLDFLKFPP
jgi:hypothetical protein